MASEVLDSRPSAKTGDEVDSSSNRQDLVLKVLGFVATGIGVLGFVTFFGGAIIWVRADEAHLPANDAVAVVPRAVLVTTGASFLVPAVLVALLAVALIFAVHLGFDLPRRLNARGLSLEARERRSEADEANRAAKPEEELAESERKLATDLREALERVRSTSGGAEWFSEMENATREQEEKATKLEARARAKRSEAAEREAEAKRTEAELDARLKLPPGLDRVQRRAEVAATALVLVVLPLATYGAVFHVGFLRGATLILVAIAAAVISLMTYVLTEKFLWLGVVAFITVGIYIGCATYFGTTRNPKVEPVAALRGERPPVTGLFIADTSSNLYLGTFADGEKAPRLLIVPRSQVTDLAVGPLLDPNVAQQRATAMALDECRQQIDKPETDTTAASASPACSKRQRATLWTTP